MWNSEDLVAQDHVGGFVERESVIDGEVANQHTHLSGHGLRS